ncbi:MAG TPA: DUF4198 domain-containing protein [Methanosarcinaceae archaeon]|nr:DUF4198 domain-containing protein [Methanosarcinaceae archaeon]HJH31288.1 DUF4198 domain-containing protein [Methanosarcinaceae archaeon]
MGNKIFIVFAMICVLLGTIGMASAHQTWMEIDAMCVDLDENVEVRITEGHGFVSEGIPPNDLSAELVEPDGSIITLDKTAEDEMYWYSGFEADQIGLYTILGTHIEEYFHKVYTGPGSREDYPTYNYTYFEGEVDWDEIDKSRWADDWHVVQYYKPYKYLKTFVSTNSNFYGTDNAFEQKFEIIPVDDVSTLGTGDFEFKVLFNGRPLPNGTVKISGTNSEGADGVSAICDENGRAVLPLNSNGDWLISAGAAGDYWDGEYNGDFPHGDYYSEGDLAFVGNTYSAALTLLEIRESNTATMRTKIRPQIEFNMNPSYFNFGELDPGDMSDVETAVIQNLGSKDLVISVSVEDMSGLYTTGLQIDDTLWSEYKVEILKDDFASLDLQLHVPGNFVGSGEMMGTIIIWSEAIN